VGPRLSGGFCGEADKGRWAAPVHPGRRLSGA